MLWKYLFCLAVLSSTHAIPASVLKLGDCDSKYFFKGHDLSSLKLLEESGTTYLDTSRHNETRAAEDILGDGGMNSVRLRLWVNPPDGIYGLQYSLDLSKRFHAKGYEIYLDFHFADSWADPQKQPTPSAWPKTLKPLAETLRCYVKDTLVAFKQAGVDPAIIALGNEIRNGMLWPTGRVDVDLEPMAALAANFSNLATLYKSARAGVDDAFGVGVKMPEVLIHIDDGWNVTLQQR